MSQSLLPNSNLININISATQPSRTWYIRDGRVVELIDGKAAIKQTIEILLNIKRYEYLIYSWNCGHELDTLIGRDKEFVTAYVPRLLKECLIQDDRILDVKDFTYETIDDGMLVRFNVSTELGDIESEVII